MERRGRLGEREAYHHDDVLDAVAEGFLAYFFPVAGRGAVFAQHHGRAMGEEVDGGGIVIVP